MCTLAHSNSGFHLAVCVDAMLCGSSFLKRRYYMVTVCSVLIIIATYNVVRFIPYTHVCEVHGDGLQYLLIIIATYNVRFSGYEVSEEEENENMVQDSDPKIQLI